MQLWQRPPAPAYRLWRMLPSRARCAALRRVAPKVTIGVAAVIADRQGRVMLAHHTYRPWRPWALPGGLVGDREQLAAALVRELREELDLKAAVGAPLWVETDPVSRHLTVVYRVTIHAAPRPDGTEVDDCRFVSLDEWQAFAGEPVPRWLAAALGHAAAVA
jgi:ADP-ribose pyrophosphatase YjhB (NUDIX family)